jgi:radical SAM protein with 4Fe4S-binding SPASM domain
MTVEEIINIFEENDDKVYFKKLLSILCDYRILVNQEEQISYLPYILLTKACNLNCIHCCADAGMSSNSSELNTEEWFSVADKLKGMKIDAICISGGEPLMRKDFFEIARYFKNALNIELTLMSNATLIDEDKASKLVELFDSFSFSLDGIDEETCSVIRGRGTFEKTMRGIRIMQAKGMKNFALSFTSTKNNQQYEEEFKKLAAELGASPMIRHYDLAGRALEHTDLMAENDLLEYFEPSPLRGDGMFHYAPNQLPVCTCCSAGISRFSVSHCGDIYPCQLLEFPEYRYENVKNLKSLKDFFEKEEYKNTIGYHNFEKIYTPHSDQCKKCHVRIHCSTCAYTSHLLKHMNNKDEICHVKQKKWEAIWK